MGIYIKKINTKYIITLLFSILWLPEGYAETIQGNNFNRILNGEYGFTIYRSCVVVPLEDPEDKGFNRETLMLEADNAEHVIFVDSGIFHFDGRGTIKTLEAKVIQLSANKLSFGDTPFIPDLNNFCEGEYNINPDRRRYNFELTCNAKLADGVELTITPFKSEGYIGRSRKTLTTNEIKGNIQKFSLSLGETILLANERICTTSGTLIKIKSVR